MQEQFLLVAVDISQTPLHPHYLILPSPPPSSTLLIKSIAVGELLMPAEPQCCEEQPSYEAKQRVQHCLAQVTGNLLHLIDVIVDCHMYMVAT